MAAAAVVGDGAARWGSPTKVAPARGTSWFVTAAGDDTVVASWVTADSAVVVRSARIVDGELSWTPITTTVAAPTEGEPSLISLALSADGSMALASWLRRVGSEMVVEASVGRLGKGGHEWSAPRQLGVSNLAQDARFATDVAVSADGSRGVVIWSTPEMALQSRALTLPGGRLRWSPTRPVDVQVREASSYSVSMSADGRFVDALWYATGGGTGRIAVRGASARITATGALVWAPAVDVVPNAYTMTVGGSPSLSVTPDGSTAMAGWYAAPRSAFIVQGAIGRRSGDGALVWEQPQSISGSSAGLYPVVSVSPDGRSGAVTYARFRASLDRIDAVVASVRIGRQASRWSVSQSFAGRPEAFEPVLVRSGSGTLVLGYEQDVSETQGQYGIRVGVPVL
jgi:hypothetical protein